VTGLPLVVALLLAGPPIAPADRLQPVVPAGAQRAEIQLRFPPWQFTGAFSLSAMGIEDRGEAHDLGAVLGPQKEVERILEGERGTLTLRLRAETRAGFPFIFGVWQVKQGTGAYAGLQGGGTFTAVDGGVGKGGSPFELQTLLGRVGRR
jgi:hypothetical protein